MPECIRITDPADPRIAAYRNLKQTNTTRWSGLFVAEGEKLVERLLVSDFPVASLLLAEQYADRFQDRVPPEVPVFLVPDEWIEQLVGFNFHRGVLACGRRKPARPIAKLFPTWSRPARVVVCPDVQDPENLGAILRISSAFGIAAVVLGPHCADPFSRRVLRVSMGAAFRVPIVESQSLERDLDWLRATGEMELWATVLDPDAEPLATASKPQRLGLLLGSEGHGLEPRWLAYCHRRVTIPMPPGVDSLNVAVAAGIFLYELSRPAPGQTK